MKKKRKQRNKNQRTYNSSSGSEIKLRPYKQIFKKIYTENRVKLFAKISVNESAKRENKK